MKKNFIRTISLVLALVMSLSLMTTAFAAETDVDTDDENIVVWYDADGNIVDFDATDDDLPLTAKFSDVKSSAWYYSDVTECAKLGIVQGFADGTFKPDDKVTDIQFIVMLTRTFYNDKVEAAKKTETSTWYAPNTKVAADVKMSNGLTLSDKAMNRYDMALTLYNVILNQGKKSSATSTQLTNAQNSIKDWKQIQAKYTNAVKYNYALGIITGMSDGTFSGSQSMTRAQACTVIMRMMKLINNYNPGDKDNNQYDDGKTQDTGNNNTSGKLANGKDITVENVLAILDEIKREYPTGTIWGFSGTAGNHYYANGGTPGSDMANLNAKFKSAGTQSSTSLKYACGGWACMVTERIFGKTGYPFREVTDSSKVRPGDVLITVNNNGFLTHLSIASSAATPVRNAATGKTLYQFSTCGGNVNGLVKWATDAGSGITSNFRCFTRYPD